MPMAPWQLACQDVFVAQSGAGVVDGHLDLVEAISASRATLTKDSQLVNMVRIHHSISMVE